MSVFVDQMHLRFLDDAFVQDLLKNQLGLVALFQITYDAQDVELQGTSLASVQARQFQMPAFETIRMTGTEERILPDTQRVKIDHSQPRYGRLAWVDVLLNVLLSTKVRVSAAPIDRITVQNLIDKLGGVASITDLQNKLKALYPDSVVNAFFDKLRITTLEDFKRRANLFLEFVYRTPPPFDPNDPQNMRTFPLNICVKVQPELKIAEALQGAKLCRTILENEKDAAANFQGGEIKTPYVFVVLFPDSAATDNSLPGLTAAQIKASTKALFASENMLAHFLT